jgi:hypothetical protein
MVTHNLTYHIPLKKLNLQNIKGKIWRKYDKVTPMMSAEETDHVWSLKELLTFPFHVHKNISS